MNKLRVLLRYAACAFLFFFVWEACARIDDYVTERAPLLGNYGVFNMLTSDAFGVVGKPYGRFSKWKLNALGYRGPDVHFGTEKVICVGASETFGMGETEGMEYPRQLEREFNARVPGRRFEVVNVAYAGQSLSAFAHRVDHVVQILSPTMAIIYPSFLPYTGDVPPGSSDPVEWVQEPDGPQSRIVGKLLNSIDRLPPWVQKWRYRYHIWRGVRRARGRVRPTIPEARVEQFRCDLSLVLDRLQQNNVCPVLVTHATFFGASVDPDERFMLTAWRRFEPTLADEGWLDVERRMNAVIRQEASERSLQLIDAANALSGPENFTDWVHFTDKGAHKLADMIADTVIRPN